jgi:hypothetical protein
MSMEALNRWFTLLANIGVLAGILFLALEISQNTSMMRADSYQNRSDSYRELWMSVPESELLATALAKIDYFSVDCAPEPYSVSTLTDTEVVAIHSFLRSLYVRLDNLRFQYTNGVLDRAFYETNGLRGAAALVPMLETFGIPGMAQAARDMLEENSFDTESHQCAEWF